MQSILSFYQKIYEQELSKSKLMHLHSSQVKNLFFFSKEEEVLTEELPYIPISDEAGKQILKTMGLKPGELKLKYYALARISRFISMNKYESTRIYSLISYEAEILVKNGMFYLTIDKKSRQFIRNNIPNKVLNDPLFKENVENEKIDLHFTSLLSKIINQINPDNDTDELHFYPELWSKKQLNIESKKSFKPGDKYIPIGVTALIENELNTFTTLDELKKLTQTENLSQPMEIFFDTQKNSSKEKRGIICEELNKSQFSAIENSNENIVSVISGPPGTGKSFTIANITAEKVSKGNSVLISSKNSEALQVIEDKVQSQLGI